MNHLIAATLLTIWLLFCLTTIVIVLKTSWKYLQRFCRPPWYEEVNWQIIRDILTLGLDPLDKPARNIRDRCRLVRNKVRSNEFGLYLLFLLLIVLGWWCLRQEFSSLFNDVFGVVESGFHLLPIAAIVGLATAVGIFFQIRANARSKNRQEWINTIRELMAKLVDHARSARSNSEIPTEFCHLYTQLELYLNPSEIVHRSFLYAIATICPQVHVACEYSLGFTMCRNKLNLSAPQTDDERVKLVEGIVRLANVLLKREWEQVKRLR